MTQVVPSVAEVKGEGLSAMFAGKGVGGCKNADVENRDSRISALVVRQWLAEWEKIPFDPSKFQRRPPEMFLLASVPAKTLRRLSDAHRREPQLDEPREADTSIQRQHEHVRSEEISRFVRTGYPLSSFSESRRQTAGDSLRKPGWLPTAIVVNILQPGDQRPSGALDEKDAIRVPSSDLWERNNMVEIRMPESWDEDGWSPSGTYPIEVIDGQHRLWAFSEDDDDVDDYDLPVVAFVGLDFSWQAYLFWTINIKPKKINASLAYDLYPLLRDQDWLEQGEGLSVYRETRAQELTEALWSYPSSVWRGRINMLGRTGVRRKEPVTQAAFVRAISESFVRSWKGPGTTIGGLFGGSQSKEGLDWSRAQQAAFLIHLWNSLHESVRETQDSWAQLLRADDDGTLELDLEHEQLDSAFASSSSLLASDQGVRGVLQVVNDMTFLAAEELELREWRSRAEVDRISNELLDEQLAQLRTREVGEFVSTLTAAMASYDWRNAKAPDLSVDEKLAKQALRGTGGYAILRNDVLTHLASTSEGRIGELASNVLELRKK